MWLLNGGRSVEVEGAVCSGCEVIHSVVCWLETPRRSEIADLCQHGLHSIPLLCSPLHLSASPCSILSVCVIDCPPLLHIHLLLLPLPHYCTNKLHITQQPDLPYSGFCSVKGYSSQII